MTSSKIDSSSFTLNDFLLLYLNFILLPYSKRETVSMAMKFAEYRCENNEILLPLVQEICSFFVLTWPTLLDVLLKPCSMLFQSFC